MVVVVREGIIDLGEGEMGEAPDELLRQHALPEDSA
jgi:hypothetical protein